MATLFICATAVNEYFRQSVSPGDVVWAYAGVRSLYDDGREKAQEISRDHVLEVDSGFRRAPLVTLYGGKLTTYRRVAEEAVDRIAKLFYAGSGMDRVGAAAGRRSRPSAVRGLRRGNEGALAVSGRGPCRTAGRGLWLPRRAGSGRCAPP